MEYGPAIWGEGDFIEHEKKKKKKKHSTRVYIPY
jgi:hypothetical protein